MNIMNRDFHGRSLPKNASSYELWGGFDKVLKVRCNGDINRVFKNFHGIFPVEVATSDLWPSVTLEPWTVAWKADLISLCQN